MVPDPSSLRQLPWHPAHSVALCDYQDGASRRSACKRGTAARAASRCAGGDKPHELCCRGALRRQVEHLREQGLSLRVGAGVCCSRPLASAVGAENSDCAEMEFVLCKQTRNGHHASFEPVWGEVSAPWSEDLLNLASPGTACSARRLCGLYTSTSVTGAVLDNMTSSLEQLGISVEAMHAESSPGHFEVVLRHEEVSKAGPSTLRLIRDSQLTWRLQAADNIVLARLAICQVAAKHSLTASFLPVPLPGTISGLHLHFSVWQVRWACSCL